MSPTFTIVPTVADGLVTLTIHRNGTEVRGLFTATEVFILAGRLNAAAVEALAGRSNQALDAIAAELSGQEWSADTTDAIADTIRATGREIRDPFDTEETGPSLAPPAAREWHAERCRSCGGTDGQHYRNCRVYGKG